MVVVELWWSWSFWRSSRLSPWTFSSARVEQTVDIPAPRSGVRRLQGFLPEQSATAFGAADHRFQQRLSSRSLISPFLVEAFKIYAQDRVLRHTLTLQLILRMTHFKWVFALFTKTKTVRQDLRTLGRNCFRTRAHGRRLLMTSPWRSKRRRSPRTNLTLTFST